MAKDVEFFTNFDTFDTFIKFKEDFRKDIIENGLDDVLIKTAEELRATLLNTVNQKISMNGQTPITGDNSTTQQQTNGLGQPTVDIPKSEEELIKYLTNGKSDPSKYNKSKDFSTLSESNIVFGYGSKGQGNANRVTLRMEIGADETVQSQYVKAKQFFEQSVFALPDASGNMNYYMNPGIDITPFVKIKCSVFTGDGDAPTKKGMSPQQRFERNAQKRGYADWTLKQEAVDVIRKNFINLTPILNYIKEGDYDRAREIIARVDKNDHLKPLKEQLDNLETGANVPATTQSYANAVALVNNLKIIKKISEEDVTYTLISNFSEFDSKQVDFYEEIMNSIRGWTVINEELWYNHLVQKVDALIKLYESN